MQRRKFLKGSALLSGLLTVDPLNLLANGKAKKLAETKGVAKNIIFMISDGMSIGTMSMANLYAENILGTESNWVGLYKENKVSRALMDTASANSIITDSAAASSAFGGGVRVNNGSLNVGPKGELHIPIWQKFKKQGKKAGCVTTVTITHATPAGFCVNSKSRSAEAEIAEMYAEFGFDVMMGGGDEFFNAALRKDKKDLYGIYRDKGYQVLKSKADLKTIQKGKPLLGIFNKGALPYSLDQQHTISLQPTPTLADMTRAAIEQMKDHPEGFVLQVEAGKVDWAAHANDIGALIHDQLAFDEAIKVVMDFAENDGETMVIITTDHGNANPGTISGSDATEKFNSIAEYTFTNEYLLNEIHADFSVPQVKEWVSDVNKISLSDQEASQLLSFYTGLQKEEGLYNYKKLPFKLYSEMQGKRNHVGWISMKHSGDYVELAMFGPGSNKLKPFMKNFELHQMMLEAALA